MILWWLDLQLPMQSMPIATDDVGSNPHRARCTTLCDKVCHCLAAGGQWFSLGTLVSSTNKTDRHDIIIEILLKVVCFFRPCFK
jgi:hypothetical protein